MRCFRMNVGSSSILCSFVRSVLSVAVMVIHSRNPSIKLPVPLNLSVVALFGCRFFSTGFFFLFVLSVFRNDFVLYQLIVLSVFRYGFVHSIFCFHILVCGASVSKLDGISVSEFPFPNNRLSIFAS